MTQRDQKGTVSDLLSDFAPLVTAVALANRKVRSLKDFFQRLLMTYCYYLKNTP